MHHFVLRSNWPENCLVTETNMPTRPCAFLPILISDTTDSDASIDDCVLLWRSVWMDANHQTSRTDSEPFGWRPKGTNVVKQVRRVERF